MKRHRAVVVGLGCLVMVGVTWAWWDSMATLSAVRRGAWSVAHGQSTLSLSYRAGQRGAPFYSVRFPMPVVRGPGFPPPKFYVKGSGVHREVMLSVPHGLVFSVLAIAWIAILWWPGRTRKRGGGEG